MNDASSRALPPALGTSLMLEPNADADRAVVARGVCAPVEKVLNVVTLPPRHPSDFGDEA